MTHSTADLFDQHGDNLQVAMPLLKSYGGNPRFHGEIYALRVPEDFLMIKQTLEQPGNGRILVIDGGGSMRCALLGDKLAAMGAGNGWAGVIINGCIRDSADIANISIGVMAIATCPARPSKDGGGESGVDVEFAGVTFRNGSYAYADLDGIVVSDTLY